MSQRRAPPALTHSGAKLSDSNFMSSLVRSILALGDVHSVAAEIDNLSSTAVQHNMK